MRDHDYPPGLFETGDPTPRYKLEVEDNGDVRTIHVESTVERPGAKRASDTDKDIAMSVAQAALESGGDEVVGVLTLIVMKGGKTMVAGASDGSDETEFVARVLSGGVQHVIDWAKDMIKAIGIDVRPPWEI